MSKGQHMRWLKPNYIQIQLLEDGISAVRQMVDAAGAVTLTKSYTPYGEALSSAGDGASAYGYTGEMTDVTGLVYLRARYYAPWDGRFVSRDGWEGVSARPVSYHRWVYGEGNPVRYTALTEAKRIRYGAVGQSGKKLNRPYHFFCTDCTAGESPNWLIEWLKDQQSKPGMDSHHAALVLGQYPEYFVILTPNQVRELCGGKVCFDPNLPKPDWIDQEEEP